MLPRAIPIVRRFFRIDPEAPKMRSGLIAMLRAHLDLDQAGAEQVIADLIASGHLYQATMRWQRGDDGRVRYDCGVGLGGMGSDLIAIPQTAL